MDRAGTLSSLIRAGWRFKPAGRLRHAKIVDAGRVERGDLCLFVVRGTSSISARILPDWQRSMRGIPARHRVYGRVKPGHDGQIFCLRLCARAPCRSHGADYLWGSPWITNHSRSERESRMRTCQSENGARGLG